jgi:hypothetical protein
MTQKSTLAEKFVQRLMQEPYRCAICREKTNGTFTCPQCGKYLCETCAIADGTCDECLNIDDDLK